MATDNLLAHELIETNRNLCPCKYLQTCIQFLDTEDHPVVPANVLVPCQLLEGANASLLPQRAHVLEFGASRIAWGEK